MMGKKEEVGRANVLTTHVMHSPAKKEDKAKEARETGSGKDEGGYRQSPRRFYKKRGALSCHVSTPACFAYCRLHLDPPTLPYCAKSRTTKTLVPGVCSVFASPYDNLDAAAAGALVQKKGRKGM